MGVFDKQKKRRRPAQPNKLQKLAQVPAHQKPEALFDEPPGFHLSGRPVPLEFTASTAAYFRIWIVCKLLTLLTLGLYAPWARLRKQRFLAQHWVLDGQRFQVEFNPVAKFKGRLIVYSVLLLGLALSLLYPYFQPALIALAFLPAPLLLTRSNQFNWQTLSLAAHHGHLRFNSWGNSKVLKKPIWLLGIGIAAISVSMSTFSQSIALWHVLLYVSVLLFVFLWLFPRATSHMIFQKFAHAKLGRTRATLCTNPKDIHSHMMGGFFSGSLFLFTVGLICMQVFAAAVVKDADLRTVIIGITYIMLAVCAVSFARARRLNYIFNRLTIAGMSFHSTLPPFGQAWRGSVYAALGVITLGLSVPWSTVQYNRWRAAHLQVYLENDWTQFSIAELDAKGGALDEMAQQYEIDLGT